MKPAPPVTKLGAIVVTLLIFSGIMNYIVVANEEALNSVKVCTNFARARLSPRKMKVPSLLRH